MAFQFRGQLCFGERIHLFDEDDGGVEVVAFLAFDAQFVADLSRGEKNPFGISCFRVRNYREEFLMRQIFQRRQCVRMAQHALRSKYDQRFAPLA